MTERTGTQLFRTDQGTSYYWNGSLWLGATPEKVDWQNLAAQPLTATTGAVARAIAPLRGSQDIFLTTFRMSFFVANGTDLDASNKWVWGVAKSIASAATTTVASGTIDSGNELEWRSITPISVGALLNNGTDHFVLTLSVSKTGTPGDIHLYPELTYKRVGT